MNAATLPSERSLRELIVDAGAFAFIGAVLFWLPFVAGGRGQRNLAIVAGLALVSSPAAHQGLRGCSPATRRILVWLAVSLTVLPFLGGYRDHTGVALLAYATVPFVFLVALGLTHRWPRALAPALLVSAVLLYAQGVPGWLTPPSDLFAAWRSLPWHNPSGAAAGAFAVLALARGLDLDDGPWWGALAGVSAATTWLSGSRGATAMTAIMLTIIIGARVRSRDQIGRLAAIVVVAVLAVAVALSVSPAFSERETGDLDARAGHVDDPTSPLGAREASLSNLRTRVQHLRAARGIALAYPWVGGGLGSFQYHILEAAEPAMMFSRSAHNEVAEVFAEGGALTGLPFAVTYVGVIVTLVPVLLRRASRASDVGGAAAALLLVGHTLFDVGWAYLYVPCLAAIAAALAWPSGPAPSRERSPWLVGVLAAPIALGVALAVDGSLAGSTRQPLWHSSPLVAAGMEALEEGDLARARAAAHEAARAAPRIRSVAVLQDVVALAQHRDTEALRAIVEERGGSLWAARYAISGLVGLRDSGALASIDMLLGRTNAYHPERVEPLVAQLTELREQAQRNRAS